MNDEDFFDRVKKIPAENRGLFLALVAAYVAGIESGVNKSRKHRKANVEESEDANNERSNDVIS